MENGAYRKVRERINGTLCIGVNPLHEHRGSLRRRGREAEGRHIVGTESGAISVDGVGRRRHRVHCRRQHAVLLLDVGRQVHPQQIALEVEGWQSHFLHIVAQREALWVHTSGGGKCQ